MENLVIKATITATSNKQTAKFNVENKRKSVYLSPNTKEDENSLIDFGLTKYVSEKDKKSFFVVKSSDIIKVWNGDLHVDNILSSVNDPNFKYIDNVVTEINIIKSEKTGNTFYRINAINLPIGFGLDEVIEEVKETSPFGWFLYHLSL